MLLKEERSRIRKSHVCGLGTVQIATAIVLIFSCISATAILLASNFYQPLEREEIM